VDTNFAPGASGEGVAETARADPRRHSGDGEGGCPALDRLRERISRLFDLYELGQLDKMLFQERMAGLSGERDRLTANLKARPARDGTRDMPEATTAAGGGVKVVVQDRRAQVHMASGATLTPSAAACPCANKQGHGGHRCGPSSRVAG